MNLRHGGWTNTRLECVVQIDRTAVAARKITAGSYYVGLEHIESSGDFISLGTVNPGDLASTKFAFTDSHVLYGKLRPYLTKIGLPSFSGICSTDILPLLPGPEIDRNFLFHFLRHPTTVSLATTRSEGVNLPRVSPTTLLQIRIELPPLPEQRRIASVLDWADGVRRKRRESLQLLDKFVGSVFLERFGDPVRNERGWAVVRLGDCFATKPAIGTITPATEDGALPLVRVGQLGQHDVAIDQCGRVSVSREDAARFEAREGDLLLARAIGSEDHLGKASVFQGSSDRILFDSHVMRLQLLTERLRPSFLWHWLRTPGGRRLFLKHGGRTAVQFNINATQVADVRLPLPPVEEQERFLALAIKARELGATQAVSAQVGRRFFDSLVQRMFPGNVRQAD